MTQDKPLAQVDDATKIKIGLLLAIHLVVGPYLLSHSRLTGNQFLSLLLFPLTGAGLGLVVIWASLSRARVAWRVAALIAAIAYVSVAMDLRIRHVLLINALTTAPILLFLGGLRYGPQRLRLANLAHETPAQEGFRFAIRHLAMAIAILAVVLAIGLMIRVNTPVEGVFVVGFFMLAPCFVFMVLATLWAALEVGSAATRLAVVLPLTLIVGAIPPIYSHSGGTTYQDLSGLAYYSALFEFQAIIAAASLLVVRSCGWRLAYGEWIPVNAAIE